jgi:hypothetical protein
MTTQEQDFQLIEQRELVRHGLRAWHGTFDESSNPRLMSALINGDVLWLEERKHFWIGVTLEWHVESLMIPLVSRGNFSTELAEDDSTNYMFFRVFEDRAIMDSREEPTMPAGMHGLRHGADLMEVHDFYERV